MKPHAYILAGGRSSRFGSDKARAAVDGQPLLLQVAQALKPVTSGLTIVADRDGKYADLELPTIADTTPGLGPIGGFATALADHLDRFGPGWLLLTSCDLLEVRPAWVGLLAVEAGGNRRAVVFRGERLEPLMALYHTDLLPLVGAQIAADRRAMWQLVEATEHAAIPLPDGLGRLPQANTPADLQRVPRSVRGAPSP